MPDDSKKIKVEEAMNLLVSITRQVKLTYDEHKMVEQAIEVIVNSLNSNTIEKGQPKDRQKDKQ